MSNILYAVEIAVALGLIIFVHELGHFLAAKAFGVWVRRFAIGFGPALVKWTRGETEYSLRAIPLGGFVEPMGDHPDSEGGDNPRALWRRPAWQRAVVFAAGVVMNGVLAVIFFTVASLVGVSAPSSIVGEVLPLMPAQKAGIKAGDRIVAINGEPVQSFEDVLTTIKTQDAGTIFDVAVERPTESGEPDVLTFAGIKSWRGPNDDAPAIGVGPALEPVVCAMVPGVPEAYAGLKVGDRILKVNDKAVRRWREMEEVFDEAPDGPVTLAIQRNGKPLQLTVDPAKLTLADIGMAPPIAVRTLDPDGPAAKAGIWKDDRIVKAEDVAWPTAKKIAETIKAAGDGAAVRLTIRRKDKVKEIAAGIAVYGDVDYARIGISMMPDATAPIQVGEVQPDGPAAKAGIRPGDRILTVGEDEVAPGTWDDVYAVFGQAGERAVPVLVKRGDAELRTTLTPALEPIETFKLFGSKPGLLLYEPLPRLYNPIKAAGRGFTRTWRWLGNVYANLRQLLKRQVGTESLGGPVLIVYASLGIAARGIGTFIDFWGILSVCVAVFNFLPVPPLDGGHVLFVILEKIKGSPVGLKVRTWVWGAGWAAVGALIILIMWQDITRLM